MPNSNRSEQHAGTYRPKKYYQASHLDVRFRDCAHAEEQQVFLRKRSVPAETLLAVELSEEPAESKEALLSKTQDLIFSQSVGQ